MGVIRHLTGSSLSFTTTQAKHLLLVLHSIVYMVAFASLYWQIPGWFGENGLMPVSIFLDCDSINPFRCDGGAMVAFHRLFGLPASLSLSLCCIIGIMLALITIPVRSARNAIVYSIMFYMYFSAFQVGREVLWYQWDTLLLESGFLMILLAAIRDGPADTIALYLVRWLATRLMFASGVVKLQSGCPAWWSLTALDFHYESQCIPTPLSWYFHHLPNWFNRLSVAMTFYIEIYLPILFMVPFETLRWFAGVSQLKLMLLIMLSGNYNFFNFLYAFLCISLFEVGESTKPRSQRHGALRRWSENLLFIGVVGYSFYHFTTWFGIQFDSERMIVESEILFTRSEFDQAVHYSTLAIVAMAVIGFLFKIGVVCFQIIKNSNRVSEILHLLFVVGIGSLIFAASMVPFSYVDRSTFNNIPKPVKNLHESIKGYHILNSYGLFRRMTGLEGRPEVIVEGATKASGPWKEIQFHSKVGAVDRALLFVLPHQPRLDWQMWFLALGRYQENPWFISLVYHLMNNNTDVIRLLHRHGTDGTYPFTKEEPMNFVRAKLYHYRFTKKGERNWWTRELHNSEFMPVFSKGDPALKAYLEKNNIIGIKEFPVTPSDFANILRKMQDKAGTSDQVVFVNFVFATLPIAVFMMKKFQLENIGQQPWF